ncbi:MAG: hypothetical protein ACE5H9_01065 [Anaerolineae bacterium]
MTARQPGSSWTALVLFYVVLLLVITTLDWVNGVLGWMYWASQVGLVTVGMVVFAAIGLTMSDLSAQRGVLLAFTVGALTIIPAALMGLGLENTFWDQYILIAMGMAAGSFLSFLFLKFTARFFKDKE